MLAVPSAKGKLKYLVGKEIASFAAFHTKNDHFTKTDSGQTWEKLRKKSVVFLRDVHLDYLSGR
jgi:hypothetical protein